MRKISNAPLKFFKINLRFPPVSSFWSYFSMCFFRDVFMEKHWKSVISRSVCDYFFDHQRKVTNPEDIPPVIATPHHYLISVHRCGMFFVAVCTTEGKFYPGNFPTGNTV
jgi:hypothetical protein